MYEVKGFEEGQIKVFFHTSSIRIAERMLEVVKGYPDVTYVQIWEVL